MAESSQAEKRVVAVPYRKIVPLGRGGTSLKTGSQKHATCKRREKMQVAYTLVHGRVSRGILRGRIDAARGREVCLRLP
jgi:hypothetical protein